MQQKIPNFPRSVTIFINIIGVVVVFFILKELQEIFIPLAIAYFLFLIFSPLNNFFGRRKFPLWLIITLDLLILIIIFGGISTIFINSMYRFGLEMPGYLQKLDKIVSSVATSWGIENPTFTNFNTEKFVKEMNLQALAGSLFSSTFSFMGTTLFVLFFFIFMATSHKNIHEAFLDRFISTRLHSTSDPDAAQKEEKGLQDERALQKTFDDISGQVQKYTVTKFIISLFTGIIEGGIIWAFGVDFAIIWGVSIFFFNFIPNIGSFLGLVPPVIMALVQFGSIGKAVLLGSILAIADNIIGNLIEPRVFGETLGLNPIVVLISLLLWGYIWGIPGALLSVPLTSLIKILISRSDSPDLKFINKLMG
ncbi:MAG: AI-2E family transporter [Ignavibacteriales bacterium]